MYLKVAEPDEPGTQGVIGSARAGDSAALAIVEASFDAHPVSWDVVVRLSGAEERLIASIAGADALKAAGLRRRADTLRHELTGASASSLERLVIERIVMTWLGVVEAERLALHVGERSIKQADFYDRRLERAQRRHLASIKALAVIRRLALPVVQLNVTQQQVNIGQIAEPRDRL
jgi:hypothetical protein